MANALACSFLESDGEVSALRPEWEVLSRMAGSSDLLLSFGWYMAWRSVFGARLRNGVVAFRRNSALVMAKPIIWVLAGGPLPSFACFTELARSRR